MVIMSQQKKFSKSRKPKLPRKRKKACIKAQGRASYYSTVNLAKVEGEWPCKFWVNSTVEMKPVMINGTVALIPTPAQYWENMIEIPVEGIATDAAHSTKNKITEFQGIDLRTGKRIFYQNLGNKTVNIGEFLGVVEAAKYIIENDYSPRIIYTDSITAIAWFQNKKTASKKKCKELQKAEIFLKTLAWDVDTIEVRHWNNKEWGETPADFGNK